MGAIHLSHDLVGTILHFNLSPKGVPEGFILKSADKTVQINFDHDIGGQITQVLSEGQSVIVEAMLDKDLHDDAVFPVFNLITISASSDKALPLIIRGEVETDVAVKGIITRLNHARRGEINGAILDTGEFVHLRPHGVKAIGGLAVGQTLEAQGGVKSAWAGQRVIEARVANGIEIGKPQPPHHDGKHKKAAAY